MDEIRNTGVWVTDIDTLKEEPEVVEKVDYIINLSSWCNGRIAKNNRYLHIPIEDGDAEEYQFNKAVDTAIERIKEGDDVLIHCAAGVSRSVTVAATALCVTRNSKFPDQLGRVSNERGGLEPVLELKKLGRKYLKNREDYNISVYR